MSMSDPIADMLTRLRNGLMARQDEVEMPASKLKTAIAQVLEREGYVNGYEKVEDQKQGILRIRLKYKGNTPVIEGIQRVSKPSRRVYVPHNDIPLVMSGLGISVLSTNKGLMSDREARDNKLGGEIICSVW